MFCPSCALQLDFRMDLGHNSIALLFNEVGLSQTVLTDLKYPNFWGVVGRSKISGGLFLLTFIVNNTVDIFKEGESLLQSSHYHGQL